MEIKNNLPTPENQAKVRAILSEALDKQSKVWIKDQHSNSGAIIDVLSYCVEHVPGTKRVLYSLPEYNGEQYSAMIHLQHAKPLHKTVTLFLKKELAFLAPTEATETKGE